MNEREIFMAALDIDDLQDRVAFLDVACGGDAGLREQVDALLKFHDETCGFPQGNGVAPTMDQPIIEGPGTFIGLYKLLQEIGHGGMGLVFMAEQSQPVKRRVAVKIIKPGMDTRQVIARFEAERQALAMMDHPNIAKVLDAGTTDTGRPYFVMELVHGAPLTQYCDQQHLNPRERLELFLPVCQAVQHAHQKGIIHRDLKPSNVLVAIYDGQPIPKVIDFGVAKAISQSLTEKTLFTQFGQVVGTLEYMSPEQARADQLDVDTRSDIYSLGVMLYELLTGTTPLEKSRLRSAAFDEMLKMIREEDPPRPSARLSTVDTLPSIAANRRVEPRKLTTQVRGDLDWIVMKSLEKDRARRYETANGFASDIQRFLNDEAVHACPPSTAYRVRKFVHRHRGPVTAATALLCVLLLGLVGTSLGVVWARRAEKKAVAERDRAEELATTNKQLAVEQTRLADRNMQLAEGEREARQDAEQKSHDLERQLHVSTAMRLAAQSQTVRKQFPARSLLLSVEALEATTRHGEPPIPTAEQAFRDTLAAVSGDVLAVGSSVVQLAASPDSHWLASASTDRTIRLWDLTNFEASPPRLLDGSSYYEQSLSFSRDGHWLVAGARTSRTHRAVWLWELTGEVTRQPSFTLAYESTAEDFKGWSNQSKTGGWIAISPESRWLAVGSEDQNVRIWDLKGDLSRDPLVWPGHTGPVQFLTFSPDGRWLAAAETLSGADIRARNDPATSDTREPNGEAIRLWDLETATPNASATELRVGGPAGSPALAFSSDSRRLITNGPTAVQVWDVTSESAINSGPLQVVPIPSSYLLRVTPNDKWLIAVGEERNKLALYDLQKADQDTNVPLLLAGHEDRITALAVSPDSRLVATASRDYTVRLWDLTTSDPAADPVVLRGHERLVTSVVFSPNGRWLVSGSEDGTIRIWNVEERSWLVSPVFQEPERRADPRAGVYSVAVSPDGHWLATLSGLINSPLIRLWDLQSPRQTSSILLEGPTETVNAIRIDHAGRWLAACCQDKKVYLWDLRREQPAAPIVLADHALPVSCIAFSPDGQYLATGERGLQPRRSRENVTCAVRLWRLTFGAEPERVVLGTHARLVGSVEFTPNGRWLISISDDETAFVWDLLADDVAGSKRVLRGHSDPITALAVSPDNQHVATASAYDYRGGRKDNTARVWDLSADDPSTSQRILQHAPDGFGLFSAVFGRNGRYLVTGGLDATARIWDLDAAVPESAVVDLGGHEAPVTSLTISPNGRWLATACEDQNSYNRRPDTPIRLWDLSGVGGGKVVSRILRGHSRGVESIAFTPDDNWLVSGSIDGSARMWDLRLAELVERARRVAGRTFTDEERDLYVIPPVD